MVTEPCPKAFESFSENVEAIQMTSDVDDHETSDVLKITDFSDGGERHQKWQRIEK
jgi:hypothetical protein